MTKELPTERIENTQVRLSEALEDANKLQRSPLRPIWQGALFGIGSTVGLGLALYLLTVILQPFTNFPVFGDLIRAVQPNINQTIDTTKSTTTSINETSDQPKPSTTSNDSQSTIRNNYFALELPGSWSLKINQSSGDTALVMVRAETDDGAQFIASVNEQASTLDYPSDTTGSNLTIDGQSATGHEYNTNATTKILDAQLEYKGEHYLFSITFNPETLSGRSVFDNIIGSISLQS